MVAGDVVAAEARLAVSGVGDSGLRARRYRVTAVTATIAALTAAIHAIRA